MADRSQIVARIAAYLNDERGGGELPTDHGEQRRLVQALLTARPPGPLPDDIVAAIDALLQDELAAKAVTEADDLPATSLPGLGLWRGDIATLRVDAIVNAANAALLGCFTPFHRCIDNVIHCAAGPRLREECHRLMAEQGHEEPTGSAKLTPGYNLPAAFVLHTVGPIVPDGRPTAQQAEQLASCYRACLDVAATEPRIRSVAFCCISTGVFGYPQQAAAAVAVETVRRWLTARPGRFDLVVFNVFADADREIYERLLGLVTPT